MKVAVHIISSLLLSIPMLFAVGALLDVSGLVPGLGFLAWNISYRLANMHRRGVCSIVDAALVSPGLNFIVRCRGGAVFQLGGEL
jgi:hypothetical protein